MDYRFICKIGNDLMLKNFLRRNYGLELLFCLEEFESLGKDNGIEDTYEELNFFKPKKAAFGTFCKLLVDMDCIHVDQSISKKSKKILRLTPASKKHLALARNC